MWVGVMPRVLHAALLVLMLLTGSALHAQEQNREQAAAALSAADAEARAQAASRLGDVGTMADAKLLVRALRDADEDVRESAEQALWRLWSRSGNAKVDALYATGVRQMSVGDLEQSIATFSQVIKLKPDFAEGWNKRATLYFLVGDLRKSLADCDHVIKLNPYHFGVLAGYAQIYARMEYYDRALDYSRRALEVNPNMVGVQRNIELLEQLIEQRQRNTI